MALATYLLDSVDENIKHAIILYLLFDLAAVAHGNQEQVLHFVHFMASSFNSHISGNNGLYSIVSELSVLTIFVQCHTPKNPIDI